MSETRRVTAAEVNDAAIREKARELQQTPIWRASAGHWASSDWSAIWLVVWFDDGDEDAARKEADRLVPLPHRA